MPKMKSMKKNGLGLSRHHSDAAYFMSHSTSTGYYTVILLDIVGGEEGEGVTCDC